MMPLRLITLAALSLGGSVAALAQTAAPPPAAGNILDKAINTPGVNWSVYGATQTNKMVKTDGVPGGGALQVAVQAKGANPWDVGANSPIQKGIAAEDVVLAAIWLRAPALKEGETTPLNLSLNGAAAPYTGIGNAGVTIGRDWKLYYVSGKAAQAFGPGQATVSMHLATAKHVVQLGPVFVLDFGKDYDLAKLPKN